ncbi:MAG: MBL fold metallo-hydrolase [Cyclobacteriaceae bacterium]
MILVAIVSVVALIFVVAILFINLSPQFGGKATESEKEQYTQSGHYENGAFENQIPTSMDMSFSQTLSMMSQFFKGGPNRAPENKLPVLAIDSLDLVTEPDSITRITWFGHSAFLLEIQGQNILIDPMFGDVPAPHPLLGRSRFSDGLPIEIEQLPQIDALILSHDHYDHLDYGSIVKLKDKVKKYYMPLGVGAHFKAWGVNPEDVNELNWWDEIEQQGLKFVCTPARHFSGRGISDRFATFWSSWSIIGDERKIFFSGDSGYGPHFKAIGEKYGPFDFAMMECGQYNKLWSNIHMMPEETAQAGADVRAQLMMPIHWGSFVLAMHTWNDPVIRVTNKAKEIGQPIVVPQIGEPIVLGEDAPESDWWRDLK